MAEVFFLIFVVLLTVKTTRGILEDIENHNEVQLFDIITEGGVSSAIETLTIILVLTWTL